MLYAVAFLPPADVVQGFQELVDEVRYIYNDEVDQLLDYFKDNFICCFRKNTLCRPPSIALDLWNMFNRTDDELSRTNNSLDKWHISSCHLVFCKFLIFCETKRVSFMFQ